MICSEDQVQQVIDCMDAIAPSNKFIDLSGTNIVFAVPIDATEELAPLF